MLYPQYFIDDLKNRADIVRKASDCLVLFCRCVLVPMLFFIFSLSIFAQERPTAVLVDEFSSVGPCEDVSARFDNFVLALHNNPDSAGFALIVPELGRPGLALFFEEQIVYAARFRMLKDNSPEIVLGKPSEQGKVQFWMIPKDAARPKYDAAEPGEIFANLAKPFIYNTEFGGEACPAVNPRLLANLMASNPNIDLQVIVRGKTAGYRNRKMNEWLNRLVSKEKISTSKIRVILSKKLEPDFPYQNVEFWVVPVKKH